jgi:acyl-CoA reductase-like NAD-dependent aldehyde dehydrogenase
LRPAESRDPATGELWKQYETATGAEVLAAVSRARAAQPAWRGLPLSVRIRALRRFHECLYRRRSEVADALTRENGKPRAEAMGAEVAIVLDYARYYADHAPRFLRAPWHGATPLATKRKRIRILREPFGVIGIISPWNYPLMLAGGAILPALVTGNAVVLKPSEFTPTSGALLGELFLEAGVPAGVFTVLQGDGSTGAALCDSPVDKIFFTGSVATGRRVAVKCAEKLIPCGLELGGSDPAVVLADADIAHAASGIAWGRFSNAGQTCVAPKRVFVEATVHDAFVAALATAVGALRVGAGSESGTDVGPMIRPEAVDTMNAQRDDAVAKGATIAAVAVNTADSAHAGNFFAPTVLTNVRADSRVLIEETFGPLLPVVKVRDADEAIVLANASEFGLSASIWSRDVAAAARLAERIDAGSVAINDSIVVGGMADVPHGGVKHSGSGRSHGMAGLEECVRTKTIVADQFKSWRQAWWFGYGAAQSERIDAYVRFAHGTGIRERLGAVAGLLRLLFSPQRPV